MASTDDLRVGDSEREAVAAELREHYAQGRLSLEDFEKRLDAAFAARTRGELDKLIADLPHARPSGAPLPAPPGSWRPHGGGGPRFGPGGFGHGERRRARVTRVTSLLAAIASLVIVFVVMAGLSFSLPGRLGLLAVVFTVLRTIFRWLFRSARRFTR